MLQSNKPKLSRNTTPLMEVDPKEVAQIPRTGPFIGLVQKQSKLIPDKVISDLLHNHSIQHVLVSMDDMHAEDARSFLDESKKEMRTILLSYLNEGYSPILIFTSKQSAAKKLDLKFQDSQLASTLLELAYPVLPISLLKDKLVEEKTVALNIRIGKVISEKEFNGFTGLEAFRKYLLSKLHGLASANRIKEIYRNDLKESNEKAAVIEPVPREIIIEEIAGLAFKHIIATRKNFDVFIAEAHEIPNIILEIGRLREITFRAVGEGTGLSCDLDQYDAYYKQLFIWDRKQECIVGGYRLGEGDRIFQHYGVEGFYIHEFFKIKKGFHPIMQKAVELGRSFVIQEYQKDRLPLFLLWKGILHFLLKSSQYQFLYGPMSISKYYSNISKSIIVEFIKRNYYDEELAKFLKPRKPFKVNVEKLDIESLLEYFNGNLSDLDSFIEDIEPKHFRTPILLKQYVKQNAKFISFNIDPNFSDALDGFMILDLNNVPYTTIDALKKE